MEERLRSWWQQIKKHRVAIGVGAIVLVVVIVLIIVGYKFDWTGFAGKTLFDWLNLLGILAVPIVVAVGGYWLNQIQKNREQKTTEQRDKIEREIASDNQHETALQGYIDKMSELLLHQNLRHSRPEAEARTIARVRTITILFQLNARRVGYVFAFLREAGQQCGELERRRS